jgi:hypothetical protein
MKNNKFKKLKKSINFFENKIICFVNVEVDPRPCMVYHSVTKGSMQPDFNGQNSTH